MYNILRHYLCNFADAFRATGAEAKDIKPLFASKIGGRIPRSGR